MVTWKRRATPLLVAGLLVGGLISGQVTLATAEPKLPTKSVDQVLAFAQRGQVQPHAGTIEQVSNLGLPNLSGLLGGNSGTTGSTSQASGISTALELLTDNQKYRVAIAPGKARVQRYLPTGEQDVVLNGTSLWLWDSTETGSATHYVGPAVPKIDTAQAQRAAKIKRDAQVLAQDLLPSVTPEQVATKIVTAVKRDGTSAITVGKPLYVAGRSAYTLILSPRQPEALIGSIAVALDSKTGQALRVEVRTRAGNQLAYGIGYTSLTYGQPAASNFTFTAPPGAKVKVVNWGARLERSLTELRVDPKAALRSLGGSLLSAEQALAQPKFSSAGSAATASGPVISGAGFATVVRIPAAEVPAALKSAQVRRLATPAANGSRAIATTLLTVLFRANGDVLVGSVPLSTLEKS